MPKDVGKNVNHEIHYKLIIKQNKLLAEHTIKMRLLNYCPSISMETVFMNTEKSKTNKPHKFALNLSQRWDLRRSNVAVQNFYFFPTLLFITCVKVKNNNTKIMNSK